MRTICEIDSTEAVRALSEHRAPKRYLHTTPVRELKLQPVQPDNTINDLIGIARKNECEEKSGLSRKEYMRDWRARHPKRTNGAEMHPASRNPQHVLTIRFKEFLEDFMDAHPQPFTTNEFDEWLMVRNVNYSRVTLSAYLRQARFDGLLVYSGSRGNEKLYTVPNSHPTPALAGDDTAEAGVSKPMTNGGTSPLPPSLSPGIHTTASGRRELQLPASEPITPSGCDSTSFATRSGVSTERKLSKL